MNFIMSASKRLSNSQTINSEKIASERSEIIENYINSESGFIEKWGLVLLLVVLLTFFFFAAFYQFGDTIRISGLIYSGKSSISIKGKPGATISDIMVRDGEFVRKNDVLFCYNNGEKYVFEIKRIIALIDSLLNVRKKQASNKIKIDAANWRDNYVNSINVSIKTQEIVHSVIQGQEEPTRILSYFLKPGSFQLYIRSADISELLSLRNRLLHWVEESSVEANIDGFVQYRIPICLGMGVKTNSIIAVIKPKDSSWNFKGVYSEKEMKTLNKIRLAEILFSGGRISLGIHKIETIDTNALPENKGNITIKLAIPDNTMMKRDPTLINGITCTALLYREKSSLLERLFGKAFKKPFSELNK